MWSIQSRSLSFCSRVCMLCLCVGVLEKSFLNENIWGLKMYMVIPRYFCIGGYVAARQHVLNTDLHWRHGWGLRIGLTDTSMTILKVPMKRVWRIICANSEWCVPPRIAFSTVEVFRLTQRWLWKAHPVVAASSPLLFQPGTRLSLWWHLKFMNWRITLEFSVGRR